jgi:hypothetical protein
LPGPDNHSRTSLIKYFMRWPCFTRGGPSPFWCSKRMVLIDRERTPLRSWIVIRPPFSRTLAKASSQASRSPGSSGFGGRRDRIAHFLAISCVQAALEMGMVETTLRGTTPSSLPRPAAIEGAASAPRHSRHTALRRAFDSASRLGQRRIRPAGSQRRQRQGSHDNAFVPALVSAGRPAQRRVRTGRIPAGTSGASPLVQRRELLLLEPIPGGSPARAARGTLRRRLLRLRP